MPKKHEPILRAADFHRPRASGVPAELHVPARFSSFGATSRGYWQSNGGSQRGLPERSYPFSLDISVPSGFGPLRKLHFLGIFAIHSNPKLESTGTLGATIQLNEGRTIVQRLELVNGRHYIDSLLGDARMVGFGDGTSVETVGRWHEHRLDLLTIQINRETNAQTIKFKDLGSPASFSLFDLFFEFDAPSGCPFHSHGGGVTLSELPSIVRLGDRVRLHSALEQLTSSLHRADDLDESRGLALTFLAMVTAATLELGGSRSMHRIQLETARELDRLDSVDSILELTRARVYEVAEFLNQGSESPTERLMNRALAIVDRNYATNLSDARISEQLGLSTSHFRFLFRQATGHPFHKYLIAVRLEKARQMLTANELPVSLVAKAVGFSGLSHFSRAFTQRFDVTPSDIRKVGETT